MYFEKFEIDQIIYDEFIKGKTKRESYGQCLVAMQKKEELFSKLPENLKEEFNEVIKANDIFNEEECKEFVRFVLNFIKSFF